MNYKLEGTPNSPVLIFSNSLGSDMRMWEGLVPFLLPYFKVLRYDSRGHGQSPDFEANQSHAIAELGKDVLALMDKLKIEKAYFCGLSMGGLIGQWLGINHPEKFIKIAISNTGAKIGDDERWNGRIKTITDSGFESIVDDMMGRWFTPDFSPSKVAEIKSMFLSNNVSGYSHCCEAVRDADFRTSLGNLTIDTLVITGNEDPVTSVEQAEFLNANIKKSKLKILPARHLSSTELPKEFSNLLIDFFVGERIFDKGMHVRRTVLGNAHVDKSLEKINAFNGDFQSFISNYAWGEIWTRPALSKHNRSLITLSMLIALNRPSEFKMHTKAAINNGVTIDEIKEIILQSALYCGLPAANDAFHLAEEVFQELNIKY
jgi:3-oxoadipate enol-lactonase / 4-carboxymuconolactone decarboxylase